MGFRRIVVVSRYAEIQQLAGRIAQQVLFADDVAEAVDIAATVAPDLILLDDLVQPSDIRTILDSSHNNLCTAVIIAATGDVKPGWLPQFQQSGVIEYLPNTSNYEQLQQILSRIYARAKKSGPSDGNGFFADDLAASVSMAGKSKAILHTMKMIKLVGASACNPVLITGQTGTGKELVARAVHIIRHPNEQFVAVNCAALTASLLESELFGHVRGAFTGADKDKTGLLELAGQGTIFLDEISEMPQDLQAKLLRVLQEKTFRKVGGITDLVCKATIIVSSNRDLRQEVRANRFRRDLYYRLSICPITIATLNSTERRDDIRLLAEYFLKTSTVCPDKANKITSLTAMAIEAIEKHNWPGNVRELRNVIERAILLETTDKIGLSSILIETDEAVNGCGCATRIGYVERNTFEETSSATDRRNKQPEVSAGDFSLEKAERELIARALQESGWQKTRAAELLGITRATLYAKVKQHNIQRGTYIPKLTQNDPSCLVASETVTAA
jgi:DNA-binding NtrC family response regulator